MTRHGLDREHLAGALARDEFGAHLEGVYLVETGERVGFWAWLDWPERAIRKPFWDGEVWLAIRHHRLVEEVQAAMLRSATVQWLSLATDRDLGLAMNLADPARHTAEIELLSAIGCTLVASRVSDPDHAARFGVPTIAAHDESLTTPGDAVGIPSGVVDRLGDNRVRRMIIGTVEAAKASGCFTVIEDVSTREQLELLKVLGVDAALGPLFEGAGPHFV